MIPTIKPISPLRQRMLDDMAMRKLNRHTQAGYVRAVKQLAEFLGHSSERATPEDLRRFQLHLVASGISSTTLNATITGLRFFFEVTRRRLDALDLMSPVREPRILPVVLNAVEVEQIIAAAGSLKFRAALSVAYGAGLRASEVVHLKVSDIDSQRMVIRVEQGKGGRLPQIPAQHRWRRMSSSVVFSYMSSHTASIVFATTDCSPIINALTR